MTSAETIFEVYQEKDTIGFVLSSTMQNIDQVCLKIHEYLPSRVGGIKPHMFAIDLVIREGLTNAIRHGNQNDPSKKVRFEVQVLHPGTCLKMEIEDQGPGFDWRRQQDAELPEDEEHGRGILIIETYFTSYSYNDKGNILYLEKDLAS